jgi:ribonucleoside-diphosphate reductase alpha chain
VFENPNQEFVYKRTYARWLEEEGRREDWPETVDRVIGFLQEERKAVPDKVFRKLKKYMLSLDVLPSMRLVWAAGKAAKASNVAIYNCSFLTIESPEDFAEMLYILMCGTGVGFSVEKVYADKFQEVPIYNYATISDLPFIVEDDKEGWADSIKFLFKALYDKKRVNFDYSKVRAKGERLLTMGGRASGPEPLVELHRFILDTFISAQGRKLSSLELHDICCKIADIVVVGGVRRSSLISLSDLDDEKMRHAKDWPCPLYRAMSNNSAAYKEKPDAVSFLKEWHSLAASGTGERGIFNLEAALRNLPERRDKSKVKGVNPCGEILLRDKQFCNLSTVIVRGNDSIDTLLDKVETAAWVGTIQASFTDFPYLRANWKNNCEEEALLGVSLSGQMDNKSLLSNKEFLRALKKKAVTTNKKAAKVLGIKEAAAVTCGKPEGTTSQVTNSGSGCHPWYAKYFLRRYRINASDPLIPFLRAQGMPLVPEVGQTEETATTFVVSFPTKAPDGAIIRGDMTSLQQLAWYKHIQTNWCEHNQSITIYVKPNEWLDVGNWVYTNWDIACGLSFLPYDGGHYPLAPYEEIEEEEYKTLLSKFPTLDYEKLSLFEKGDNTEGAKTYACVGDACQLN